MFERLERQMDDLVERLLRRPAAAIYQRAWAPRIDLYETADEFIAVAELAGVDPGNVTIEIEGDAFTISGQRLPATPPGCADYLQLEIPLGEFERTIMLPGKVDAKSAAANFEEGMLSVRLPKAHQGPMKVQVDIERPKE
jgi:HSP20 family protein